MEFKVVHVVSTFETKWCGYSSRSRDQFSTTDDDFADDISVYRQTQANSILFLDEILLRTIITKGFRGTLCKQARYFEDTHLAVTRSFKPQVSELIAATLSLNRPGELSLMS